MSELYCMKLVHAIFALFLLHATHAVALETPEIFTEVSKILKDDITSGNREARVVIVEYSSVGCPHCEEYRKYIFPDIKEKYLDNGLALYITRDFPMNSASVMGAMLARCNGEKREKVLDILFDSQHVWAYKSDFQNHLKNIMVLSGMSEDAFNNCINNSQIRDELMNESYSAAKNYNIAGTPTLFINGRKVENVMSINEIESIISANQ